MQEATPSISNMDRWSGGATVQATGVPTATQRQFLALDAIAQTTSCLPVVVSLKQNFSMPALQLALKTALADFDVLRTQFVRDANGDTHYEVLHQAYLPIALVDLQGLGSKAVSHCVTKAQQICETHAIDTEKAPLSHIFLLRISPDHHILFFSLHHALVDEWSLSAITDRILHCYNRVYLGQAPTPWTAPQFHEISAQIEVDEQSQRGQQRQAYWRKTLLNIPAQCRPPRDFEPSGFIPDTQHISRRFTSTVLTDVRNSQRHLKSTQFGILSAALALVLGRLADKSEVTIALPVSARRHRSLEQVVGPLMNVVPLRIQLGVAPSIQQVAKTTSQALFGAMANADLAFDDIVRTTGVEVEFGSVPLCQVSLSQRLPAKTVEGMTHLQVETIAAQRTGLHYDLAFSIAEDGNILVASCDYNAAAFQRDTVNAILEQWETVLLEGLQAPEKPVISLTKEPGGPAPIVPIQRFLDAINEHAAGGPDKICLAQSTSGKAWTRRHVINVATQIADGIIAQGITRGSVIAICLPPDPLLWVTVLGVLKAGCAIAPLSWRLPNQLRCNYLERLKPDLIISEKSVPEGLRSISVTALRQGGHPLHHSKPCAEALATVMFTSGSTGTPKMVGVPHRALDATIQHFQSSHLFGSQRKVLSVTDISFDIAFLEVMGAMACGSSVELAGEGDVGNGEALADLLHRSAADMMQATPFTWEKLRAQPEAQACLQHIRAFCGGEAAERTLSDWLQQSTQQAINLYGPTETGIWSAAGPFEWAGLQPKIGPALNNETLQVLSQAGLPTPPAGKGMLHIGGVGLAHGYIHAPSLTADAFRPDPTSQTGGRLYSTGDHVRRGTDGTLTFLGRQDRQVKLRGFRIELDGLARTLAQAPEVAACEVTLQTVRNGQPSLVAYVVLKADSRSHPDIQMRLRQFATNTLAPHCVPAAYIILDRLPETISGKIDRASLPIAKAEDFEAKRPITPPQGNTEQQIASIWQQVLQRGDIGRDDNFFHLGGASLDAIQAASLIARQFETDFSFADFLDGPSIRVIAETLCQRPAKTIAVPTPRFPAKHKRVPIPPDFALALERELSYGPYQNNNIQIALYLSGAFQPYTFMAAVRLLGRRHSALLSAFGLDDGGLHLQVSEPEQADIPILTGDLTDLDATAGARLITRFMERAFDLRKAPLLRFGLFHGPSNFMVLAASASHMILDGWSLRILTQDLVEIYTALTRAEPVELEEGLQFSDYLIWRNDVIASPKFREDITYWVNRILPPAAPIFKASTDTQAATGERTIFSVSETKFEPLYATAMEKMAKHCSSTPFACFVTCLSRAVHRLTGANDLMFQLPAANRSVPEFNRTAGLMMHPIVLRITPASGPFSSAVDATWREVQAANAHQACSTELVLKELERQGYNDPQLYAEIHLLWNDKSANQGLDLEGVTSRMVADPDRNEITAPMSGPPLVVDVSYGPDGLLMTLLTRTDVCSSDMRQELIDYVTEELENLVTLSSETPA